MPGSGERPQLQRRMEPYPAGNNGQAPQSQETFGAPLKAAILSVAADTSKDIERGYNTAVTK